MSLKMTTWKTISRLNYPVIKKVYNKLSDNGTKKELKRKSGYINKNELPTLYEQNIDEKKMHLLWYENWLNQNGAKIKDSKIINSELLKNKFNFSQALPNIIVNHEPVYLINDNIHLNINLKNIDFDNIPNIIFYYLLQEALSSHNNNTTNPFNLNKKIISTYDAFISLHPEIDSLVIDDLKVISTEFYRLLNGGVKVWIKEMKNKENSIRAIRNSFSHDNYFSFQNPDGKNTTCLEELRKYLSPDQQQKLRQRGETDWIVWSIDRRNEEIQFCYIITDENLRLLFDEFIKMCNEMIEKSKQKQFQNS